MSGPPTRRGARAIRAWLFVLLSLAFLLPAGSVAGGHAPPVSSPPWLAASLATPLVSSFAHGPAPGATPAATPAAAPVLQVSGSTPSAVSLSWTATSDLTFSQYAILESANGSTGPWQTAGAVTTQSTTDFAVTGLSPGATYWWQVDETGLFGTTDSNVVNGTQPTLAFLQYQVLSSTSIDLFWSNNASYGGLLGFEQYQVWVTTAGATTSQAIVTAVHQNTTVVTGLGAGVSVFYTLNTTDCVGTCSAATELVTGSNGVTYGPPLALGASLVADRVVVDANQSDLFACTPSGGQSPFNFTWQIGSGPYVAEPSSTSWSFETPGPVTVTCWVQDSIGSHVTASTTVEVDAGPALQATANRTSVDVGQTVALTCTASLGTAPYQITWAPGNGITESGGNLAVAYLTAGTVAATCSAVDATGTTVTAVVAIDVSPLLEATASVSSVSAAPATTLTFTATGFNGSGGYAGYEWMFGDGGTATGAVATHSYGVAGVYTAVAVVNDSNGAVARQTVKVDITNLTATWTGFVDHLAPGGWLNATAVAEGGAGSPYNYTWSWAPGNDSYGPAFSHRFAQPGTFPVQLVVRDALGASTPYGLGNVSVVAPPAPSQLPTYLAIAGLIALVLVAVLVALLVVRRRRREQAYPVVAGRVPAADPAASAKGTKVCPTCGSANVATRRTCQACGSALGRNVVK